MRAGRRVSAPITPTMREPTTIRPRCFKTLATNDVCSWQQSEVGARATSDPGLERTAHPRGTLSSGHGQPKARWSVDMAPDLLLFSSTSVHGYAPLGHAMDTMAEIVGNASAIHFAPFAIVDHDLYTTRVQEVLTPLDVPVVGLHAVPDPRAAVEEAEVLFIGGGNSFRLLAALWKLGLIEPIRRRVQSGELRFVGSSAGTNMACPSLRTTNDMPIVQPPTFEALGLVPFQVNPHYLDPDPTLDAPWRDPRAADRRVPGGERRRGGRAARRELAASARSLPAPGRHHRCPPVPARRGPPRVRSPAPTSPGCWTPSPASTPTRSETGERARPA